MTAPIVEHCPDTEGCEACPLSECGEMCLAVPDESFEGYREVGPHASMGGPAPGWCPLRTGDVIVRKR